MTIQKNMNTEEYFELKCIDGQILYIDFKTLARSPVLLKCLTKLTETFKNGDYTEKRCAKVMEWLLQGKDFEDGYHMELLKGRFVYDIKCGKETGVIFVEYLNGFQSENVLNNKAVRTLYNNLLIDKTFEEIEMRTKSLSTLKEKIESHCKSELTYSHTHDGYIKYKKPVSNEDLCRELNEQLCTHDKLDFEHKFHVPIGGSKYYIVVFRYDMVGQQQWVYEYVLSMY